MKIMLNPENHCHKTQCMYSGHPGTICGELKATDSDFCEHHHEVRSNIYLLEDYVRKLYRTAEGRRHPHLAKAKAKIRELRQAA